MIDKTLKHTILLPTVVATVAVFSLAAIFPAAVAQDTENLSQLLGDNETLTDSSSINMTSSTTLIMDNRTLDCQAIATELGGIGVPSGNVCDVVVIRQAPQVTGHNGLNLNQFTLMNSVLEFSVMPANATTSSGNSTTTSASEQVYVMGDFAFSQLSKKMLGL